MELPNFNIEKEFWKQGKIVFGIDEAGRGCLAGPVVAAVVAFPINFCFKDFQNKIKINDSKKLTQYERETAFDFIINNSLFCNYSIIDNSVIDKYNILQATQIAMNICLLTKPKIDAEILVDGNYFQNLYDNPHLTVIKGDSKSLSIASASIIAKVIRDKFVVEYLHQLYPQYGFDKHKGYATKKHFEAIKKYGKTSFHRRTFLKNFDTREEIEKYQLKLF